MKRDTFPPSVKKDCISPEAIMQVFTVFVCIHQNDLFVQDHDFFDLLFLDAHE